MTTTNAIMPTNGRFEEIGINGHHLRIFIRDGKSDKIPLLVCNGLGQSIEILFPLIKELKGRTIVTFDAVGIGKSSIPGEMLSIQDHATLVSKLLGQLDIGTYDVLGISWGGSIAQQLAHDNPDKCRKLVLAVTSAGGIGSWWGTPLALAEIFLPLRYSNKTYGNLVGPAMYGGEALLNPALFRDYTEHSVAPSLAGYYGQVIAMCSWTSLGWLHRITQPTQVISGAYDGLIPAANQLLLAQKIPGAELKAFPAGHLLMYSHRKEIGPMITTFLDREGEVS